MRQLKGRVALVTGSSRGIGAAIARLFAAEGATVAVHGRDHGAVEAKRVPTSPRQAECPLELPVT